MGAARDVHHMRWAGVMPRSLLLKETNVLLILAIILLIIAIAGGIIIHPLIFALAIVALVLFFSGRR
jgi:hypothetical protein